MTRAAEAVPINGRADGSGADVRRRPPSSGDAVENLAWFCQAAAGVRAGIDRRLQPGPAVVELQTSWDGRHFAGSDGFGPTAYDPLGDEGSQVPKGHLGLEEGTGIFVKAEGTFRVVRLEPARSGLNYREATSCLESVPRGPGCCAGGRIKVTGSSGRSTGSPAFVAEISSEWSAT